MALKRSTLAIPRHYSSRELSRDEKLTEIERLLDLFAQRVQPGEQRKLAAPYLVDLLRAHGSSEALAAADVIERGL